MKNHATGEEKILFLNSEQEKDKTHFMDKESGVELELEDNTPLLEWLANNYKRFGAALEIITGQKHFFTRNKITRFYSSLYYRSKSRRKSVCPRIWRYWRNVEILGGLPNITKL